LFTPIGPLCGLCRCSVIPGTSKIRLHSQIPRHFGFVWDTAIRCPRWTDDSTWDATGRNLLVDARRYRGSVAPCCTFVITKKVIVRYSRVGISSRRLPRPRLYDFSHPPDSLFIRHRLSVIIRRFYLVLGFLVHESFIDCGFLGFIFTPGVVALRPIVGFFIYSISNSAAWHTRRVQRGLPRRPSRTTF
jgi:hypothetical protein